MNARNYDPIIGRFLQIDPLANEFPNISPYAYGNNNPLRYTDPTGMAPNSTHLDSNGEIIAAYDDGDKGVYQHDDAASKADVDVKREESGSTSGGGVKRGETQYIDEFAVKNENGRAAKNEDGSFDVVSGKINFNHSVDKLVSELSIGNEVKNYGELISLAYMSSPGMPLDVKSHVLGANDGYVLNGKILSGRSVGNYLAGRNAALSRQSWSNTIKAAGLVHIITSDRTMSSFRSPYYGEIPYAAKWIRDI